MVLQGETIPQAVMVTANGHSTSSGALAPARRRPTPRPAAAAAAGGPGRHPDRSTRNRSCGPSSSDATSAGTSSSWVGSTAATVKALKNRA